MALTVTVLRELLRNLQAFRAAYESDGLETITGPDGTEWCLWDIEYIASQIHRLSPRQKQAIELCLISNIKEKDAAKMMGVSETNPVAMYATDGLNRLISMIENGELPRFKADAAEVA